MLSIPSAVSIFLYIQLTDMRKSFDGLSGIVRIEFAADPLDGSLFLFVNRRRDRLKILQWDGSSYWLYYKPFEAGMFEVIVSEGKCTQIDSTQLAMLPVDETDYAALRPDVWRQSHPAAIRE